MTMNRRKFLKATSTGLLLGGTSLALGARVLEVPSAAADERDAYGFWRKGRWRNWSHNVEMRPKEILRPTRIEQLQEAVLKSPKIRAVGSGHSISTIAYTEDTLVNTDGLSGIVSLDRERGLVTVRGGTKLRDFNEAITRLGFCIPSTGDTTYQSLAGLLSTGTHGTGMRWGSCSDEESLVGMEIVDPRGELVNLNADRPGDLELLRAARVSLGSFGMVNTVTLKVAPVHNLEHVGHKSNVNEAFDPAHLRDNDHYEFAYFPFTDSVYQFFRNRTEKPIDVTKFGTWFHEVFLENDLAKILLGVTSLIPSLNPAVMKAFVNSFPEAREVDRADRVMTIRRKTPTHLMEVALPIENGPQALEIYRGLVEKYAHGKNVDRFFPNLPLQIRFVRADRGTLISCAEGRDTCWFGLGSYIKHRGWEPMFREMEKELIALGGRPHWGKMYFTNPLALHERFGEWESIRRKFDPQGKFASRYLERIRTLASSEDGSCF